GTAAASPAPTAPCRPRRPGSPTRRPPPLRPSPASLPSTGHSPEIEQRPSDHEPLDLGGPLVDLGDLRVAEEPFHRIVLDVPVAAVDLDGVGGDAHRALRGE